MMITIREAVEATACETEGVGAAILVLSLVAYAVLGRPPTDDETCAALDRYRRKHGEPTKADVLRIFAGSMPCKVPLELLSELMRTDDERAQDGKRR